MRWLPKHQTAESNRIEFQLRENRSNRIESNWMLKTEGRIGSWFFRFVSASGADVVSYAVYLLEESLQYFRLPPLSMANMRGERNAQFCRVLCLLSNRSIHHTSLSRIFRSIFWALLAPTATFEEMTRSRFLRSDWKKISPMNSSMTESFIKMGLAHWIDLVVSDGFTQVV